MSILNFLNPKTFWEALTKVFRNYSNRRFYKNKMNELLQNGLLKQNGMKLDRRSRAYYVLNLEPEILMMGEESLELEKSRVYESISAKSVIFNNSELSELIEAKTERIKTPDYYAYLIQIKYRSISGFTDIFYCLAWLAFATFAIYWVTQGILNWQSIADYGNQLLHRK